MSTNESSPHVMESPSVSNGHKPDIDKEQQRYNESQQWDLDERFCLNSPYTNLDNHYYKKYKYSDNSDEEWWIGRLPGRFREENIEVSEHLMLKTSVLDSAINVSPDEIQRCIDEVEWGLRLEDPAHPKFFFGVPALQSKATRKYGYFEIKCQAGEGYGISSSFWLKSREQPHKPEIDICELVGNAHQPALKTQMPINLHPDLYGEAHPVYGEETYKGHFRKNKNIKKNVTKGFNVYGLYWSEESIEWYFNGKLKHTSPHVHERCGNSVWKVPMHLIIDSEVFFWQWEKFTDEATGEVFYSIPPPEEHNKMNSTFKVEYVRVWKWPD